MLVAHVAMGWGRDEDGDGMEERCPMLGQHHLRLSQLQSRTQLLRPMLDPRDPVSCRGHWLRQETPPRISPCASAAITLQP